MLLTGRNPFPGISKNQVKQMIVSKELKYSQDYWTCLSDDAVNFVQCALNRNIEQRYSAKQLLQHPWMVRMSQSMKSNINIKE